MLGLFGSLNLGARSLQTQQRGMEVTGHNLANASNPAYARQRVNISTTPTLPTPLGPQGTGAEVTSIQQLRDALLDGQVVSEASVRGSLEARQRALEMGQTVLGQRIDRTTGGAAGAASVGGAAGLAERLSGFFGALQSLSTNPTSLAERQNVLSVAQDLASQFRQIDDRLGALSGSLNDSLQSNATEVNALLDRIAGYNQEIVRTENGNGGSANDLRDLRQQSIEALAQLTSLQTTAQANGTIDVAVGGVTLVAGAVRQDTLEIYDAGGGQMLVRAQTAGTPLTLTGGSMQGTLDARDGALASLRDDLDTLASSLITRVNAVHSAGFSLTGSTGAALFTGTGAADIGVNSTLVGNPSLLQISGTNGAVGDNQVALQLAQLAEQPQSALGNQSFNKFYTQTVAGVGQALALTHTGLEDQAVVEELLLRQRDAVSGVSLDEEMTNLVKFQRAYEASARFITTIDDMLQTVINMKR